MIFTKITHIELPETAKTGEGFTVLMHTNGTVPFAQLIIRHEDGWEWIVKNIFWA